MVRPLIVGVLLVAAAAAQAPSPLPDAEACRELARRGSNDGPTVYQAGTCFEAIGDLAGAANAYRQAMALNFQPAIAVARRAGIFLVTGQKLRALLELRTSYRQDCANPEMHQLGFWVGEWEVRPAAGRLGRSNIQVALNGCALIENWTDETKREGINLLFQDPAAGKWYHYGAASERVYFEASGEFRDGALRLSGTRPFPHRRTLAPVTRDQLRDIIEASNDGGVTWKVTHDVTYARRR